MVFLVGQPTTNKSFCSNRKVGVLASFWGPSLVFRTFTRASSNAKKDGIATHPHSFITEIQTQ